jgi:hypothetical protein
LTDYLAQPATVTFSQASKSWAIIIGVSPLIVSFVLKPERFYQGAGGARIYTKGTAEIWRSGEGLCSADAVSRQHNQSIR